LQTKTQYYIDKEQIYRGTYSEGQGGEKKKKGVEDCLLFLYTRVFETHIQKASYKMSF